MTTTASELAAVDTEATPAQQAMSVAVALALAAQSGVETGALAYLAGRLPRADFIAYAARQILQAVSKSMAAGEFLSAQEWNVQPRARLITDADQQRIQQALTTITEPKPAPVEPARIRGTSTSPAPPRPAPPRPTPPTATEPEPAKATEHEQEHPVVMRSKRLARAEVVTAGRTAYAEATAAVVAEDPEFNWRFSTDRDPCPRCVELATKTYAEFEDAPRDGGHPGCVCVLQAEYREDPA